MNKVICFTANECAIAREFGLKPELTKDKIEIVLLEHDKHFLLIARNFYLGYRYLTDSYFSYKIKPDDISFENIQSWDYLDGYDDYIAEKKCAEYTIVWSIVK